MTKARAWSGAGSVGDQQENNRRLTATPAPTAQHAPKPHVCPAAAPPLPCYGCDTVAVILEITALHLRRAIPALSDLTLDDFDAALAELRPQIRELLDDEIRERTAGSEAD